MSETMYYVDLPDPYRLGEWKLIGIFDTREEALECIRSKLCVTAEQAEIFITEVEV